MSAAAIISLLDHEGISIELAEHDQIRLQPADRLTPDLIGEIRNNKLQIIEHLRQQEQASALPEPEPQPAPVDQLNALQRRALNGFNYLLQQRRDHLEATGRPAKNAAVPVREGGDAYLPTLCQVMGIEFYEAHELLQQLRMMGQISQSGGYLWPADGEPLQQITTDLHPDFILPDTTGRTFRLWLEGVNVWPDE